MIRYRDSFCDRDSNYRVTCYHREDAGQVVVWASGHKYSVAVNTNGRIMLVLMKRGDLIDFRVTGRPVEPDDAQPVLGAITAHDAPRRTSPTLNCDGSIFFFFFIVPRQQRICVTKTTLRITR